MKLFDVKKYKSITNILLFLDLTKRLLNIFIKTYMENFRFDIENKKKNEEQL